jgi:hypothetical protein
MKTTINIIALVIAAVSFNATADLAQAQEAVSHAERGYSSAQSSYKSAAREKGSGVNGGNEEHAMNEAGARRAEAYNALAAAQHVDAAKNTAFGNAYTDAKNGVNKPVNQPSSGFSQAYTDAKNGVNIGAYTKNDPTGTPLGGSINVAAGSLAPSTEVTTPTGQIVSASSLAPSLQVAVALDSAFTHSRTGNRQEKAGHPQGAAGHSGRGAENAQNSAHNSPNGRAHGL